MLPLCVSYARLTGVQQSNRDRKKPKQLSPLSGCSNGVLAISGTSELQNLSGAQAYRETIENSACILGK
jgi:hypothetical protein